MLLDQLFDPAYRVRLQKHIATYGTDFRRDVVDDQQLASVPHRVCYALRFVRAGTSVNTAPRTAQARVDVIVLLHSTRQDSLKLRHTRHVGQ